MSRSYRFSEFGTMTFLAESATSHCFFTEVKRDPSSFLFLLLLLLFSQKCISFRFLFFEGTVALLSVLTSASTPFSRHRLHSKHFFLCRCGVLFLLLPLCSTLSSREVKKATRIFLSFPQNHSTLHTPQKTLFRFFFVLSLSCALLSTEHFHFLLLFFYSKGTFYFPFSMLFHATRYRAQQKLTYTRIRSHTTCYEPTHTQRQRKPHL